MNISISNEPKAEKVKVTHRLLIVYLVDGRKLEVPLIWFPRLFKATLSQKKKYRLIGNGIGIHWPDLDEDISVGGLMKI